MTLGLINANPVVHAKKERVARTEDPHGDDAVDPLEIYDILLLLLFYFFSFSIILYYNLLSRFLFFYTSAKLSYLHFVFLDQFSILVLIIIFIYIIFTKRNWYLWLVLVNFVRDIRDPEHPYSLEQLSVLSEESITVDEKLGRILWVVLIHHLRFHSFSFLISFSTIEID